MANTSSAVFGLFVNDKASEIFKKVGATAKGSSKSTKDLANDIDTASRKMIVATNKTLTAQGRVKVSQKQLDDLRGKSNVSVARLTAAEEKLAMANRNASAALRESSSATQHLASTQDMALTSIGKTSSKMSGLATSAKLAAKAFVLYRGAQFVKQSIQEAAQNETAQNKLSQAYKNSGSTLDAHGKSVQDLDGKLVKLGFDGADTKDALAVLVTATKDPTKSIALMGTVGDLARYKNITLSESAFIVAKATQGQLKPLKALAIDLPIAAGGALKLKLANDGLAKAEDKLKKARAGGKTKDIVTAQEALATAQKKVNEQASAGADIAKALSTAVAGQAETFTKSFAGQLGAAKAQWKDFQESAGMLILPGLKTTLTDLTKFIDLIKNNKGAFETLGALVGAAVVGKGVAKGATGIAKLLPVLKGVGSVAGPALGGAAAVGGGAAAVSAGAVAGVIIGGGLGLAAITNQLTKNLGPDKKIADAEKARKQTFAGTSISAAPGTSQTLTSPTPYAPTIHVTVQGSVTTQKELAAILSEHLYQTKVRGSTLFGKP